MQKTADEMRISDWSSDVCSSDLTSRRSAGTSSSVGSTTRNKQKRVNAALNGPVTNCLRERNDLAAGRVSFPAPTRRQADGNKQYCLINRQKTTHKPDLHPGRLAAISHHAPTGAWETIAKKKNHKKKKA